MDNETKTLGEWGENIAARFLEKKGYSIIERNFRRKWGEIDIICLKTENVPRGTFQNQESSVPRGTKSDLGTYKIQEQKVPRRTFWRSIKNFFIPIEESLGKDKETDVAQTLVFVEVKTIQSKVYIPEDNITPEKMRRLIRSCHLYLAQKNYDPEEIDWQIDTIGIVVDKSTGKAKVNHMEQAVYL